MHSSPLLLVLFCAMSLAAPPLDPPTVNPSSTRTLPVFAPTSLNSSHSSTRIGFHHPPQSSDSIHLPTLPPQRPPPRPPPQPPPRFPPFATHTFPFPPASTNGPQINGPQNHHNSSQNPMNIFFEVLGGLIGLIFIISCFRCCYIYNRTPKRDRVEAILERHQLERELAELERNPHAIRRSPTSDPLPVYFPPPPTYESVAPSAPAPASTQRSGYSEVATGSPTSSPSASPRSSPSLHTRELESVPLEPPIIPRPAITPSPNG